jgi:uncharacterized protein
MGKFIVTKRKNGEFQFNLKTGNGQVILTSEGYAARSGCMNGIDSVRNNAANEERYHHKKSVSGQFYFNLKSPTGQIIGSSEMYETESARDRGIASVKTNGPGAAIEDKTLI